MVKRIFWSDGCQLFLIAKYYNATVFIGNADSLLFQCTNNCGKNPLCKQGNTHKCKIVIQN